MTGFINLSRRVSAFEVVADEVDIITKPVSAEVARQLDAIGADGEPVKELDVQETVILEEKPAHPIISLLTGLPSPSSWPWSATTFSINLLLVLGIFDLTFRAAWFWPVHDLAFARVGYVSDTSAKVFVREPDLSQLPIFLSYRYADAPVAQVSRPIYDSSWKHAGKVDQLHVTEDWSAVLIIENLEPDTRYQWALSNNRSGHLITAPSPGTFSSRASRTSPSSPRTKSFTFLHSSCIIPHFPYNPFDHPLHIPGLSYLSETLAALKPSFFLFLGDFIYIDVPHRHGSDVETYRRQYRHVYASPDWQPASTVKPTGDLASYDSYNLPWLHVWDDHEISNDWSRNTTPPYDAALDAYTHYHLAPNPALSPRKRTANTEAAAGRTYYTFTQGPLSFFVTDTRRYRSAPNTPTSTMLGATQLTALKDWLAAPEPPGTRWKMVVSSVPFTRNWRVNGADTWGGFLAERRAVLDAMWAVNSPAQLARRDGLGVVVLSGDRHEHATTAFPPPEDSGFGPEATVTEFSTSPLNMFYLPLRTYREDAVTPFHPSGVAANATQERDVCIHYEPEGNSKFGAVRVEEGTGSGQSVLRYGLWVDGVETWSHVLIAPERRSGLGARYREGVWN